jgi:hypothetical protein
LIPIGSRETDALAEALEVYDLRGTVSRAAALLTIPHFQANALRLELLVHLGMAKCGGRRKASTRILEKWLNDDLGQPAIAMLEDPAEDVFVTNVQTSEGNRRVFEGLWESSDYYLQVALDTLSSPQAPPECRDLLTPALALLRVSEVVADRLGLDRWSYRESSPGQRLDLSSGISISARTWLWLTREPMSTFSFLR